MSQKSKKSNNSDIDSDIDYSNINISHFNTANLEEMVDSKNITIYNSDCIRKKSNWSKSKYRRMQLL